MMQLAPRAAAGAGSAVPSFSSSSSRQVHPTSSSLRHRVAAGAPPLGGTARRRGVVRAAKDDNKKDKQAEYVEALKKGGIDQQTAKQVLEKWKEAGADSDPSLLRKLFLKQSLAPIAATGIQTLFDGAAAYSIFISSSFFALGPDFTGRPVLVFLLDALAIYFAVGVFFDIVTLTSVVITTARLGTAPLAFYDAVKAIAAPAGASSGAEGLAIVEKAKAAVSAVKVAQALDAIGAMLEAASSGSSSSSSSGSSGQAATGKATKSIDTLTNLSAYLTLYRAETGGFDPASVGMSEKEAANLALKFGEFDLDDNGRLDGNEFAQMLRALGVAVSDAEAAAAMEVMDTNKDGLVDFSEIARWWATRKAPTSRA